MATARKFSAEEQRELLAQLEVPFDPVMVEWKVVRRARSGRRGAVLPFVDPRAYTDRLNQALTTAGWNRTFALSTLSNLTRRLWDGSSISTGKVLVSGTVTINRLEVTPVMEKRGPTEITPSLRRKPRPSGGHAPVLAWVDTYTVSVRYGFP
jgi:hypothetical protein